MRRGDTFIWWAPFDRLSAAYETIDLGYTGSFCRFLNKFSAQADFSAQYMIDD